MFWHFAWSGTSTATPEYKDHSTQIQNVKTAYDAATSAVLMQCKRIGISSSYQQANVSQEIAGNNCNPIMYGIMKRCAVEVFKAIAFENNISCSNVILPNVYGIGDKQNTAIVFFIKRLLAHEPLNLISGDNKDDWIYIDDLVDGLICAAQSDKNIIDYYIGHRMITTFREKLCTMKSILSSRSELLFGLYPENCLVDYRQFDLDALYRDTGFEAKTGFSESIQKTAEWMQK